MKKLFVPFFFILVAVMTVFPGVAFAVEPSGFVGVPWGCNRSQAIQIMSKQGFARLSSSKPDEEVFRGVYDGMPCKLYLGFIDDSLVKGQTSALGRARTVEGSKMQFDSTVGHLAAKYGAPQDKGINSQTGYAWANWSFGDGVRSHKTRIEAILYGDGAWFTDLGPEQYFYFSVSYVNETLKATLERGQL